jgi:hypothetical protein
MQHYIGERGYQIDPSLLSKTARDYFVKTGDNRAIGIRILGSGNYKGFNGWPAEQTQNIYNLAVVYFSPTQYEIESRVTGPLREYAQARNLPFMFSGTPEGDMQPHTVVDAAVFKGMSVKQRDSVLRWMTTNESGVPEIKQRLENSDPFPLQDLVIGTRSYIGARFDASQVLALEVRMDIEAARARAVAQLGDPDLGPENFKEPYSYKNLWHCTVGSAVDVADPDEALRFTDWAYENIGRKLDSDPVAARVGYVFSGSALEFQQVFAPHLVRYTS